MHAPILDCSGLAVDLEVARQVQASLLPQRSCCLGSWTFAFSYEPAAAVGGDYVDLIPAKGGGFHFALGDVSGKGIAASMLMSYLHATLRALLGSGLGIEQVMRTTSRIFCQTSLPAQFATLVLGTADEVGNVEMINAGHTSVLLTDAFGVTAIEASNVPLGLFCNTDFSSTRVRVAAGSSLVLYSDGVTEAVDQAGNEYGLQQLIAEVSRSSGRPAHEIVEAIENRIAGFSEGMVSTDDRTVLVLSR